MRAMQSIFNFYMTYMVKIDLIALFYSVHQYVTTYFMSLFQVERYW